MTQKRQAIDIGRKKEVIDWIANEGESKPTRAIAHFRAKGWSLDGGTVRRWWRLRDKIREAASHQLRLAGGGRKPLSETLEEQLYDEFVNKRIRKEKVNRQWLADMALLIYAGLGDEDGTPQPAFAASDH